MGKYTNLNVLNNKRIENAFSDNAIDQVALMINNSGANRSQRKQLAKALNKVSNIYSQAQKRVDRSAFKEYQQCLDEDYRRFFAVLGIVMAKKYGWEETEDKEEISSLYDLINSYLEEYQPMSTDDICVICEEVTGLTLQSI